MRLILGLLNLAVTLAIQPVPTRTIVDILSSSPQFSELLDLLQRHELVPLVSQSWNSTLLAPVNSAFSGIDKEAISKEQLLYHMINGTAYSSEFASTTKIYQTYLDDGIAPISLSLTNGINNAAEFNELDLLGSPQRGLVHAISDLLDIPPTVSKQLYLDPHLSEFSSIVGSDISFGNCTVFAPVTNAIQSWMSDGLGNENSSIPFMSYLKSPFGEKDRKKLIERHIFPGILNPAALPQEVELSDGTTITVHENFTIVGPKFRANAASYIQVSRNGIIIELDRLMSDNINVLFDVTPEKFILGLGGYSLVRSLTSYGYRSWIDESLPYDHRTIVVPLTKDKSSVSITANPSLLTLYQFLEGELPDEKTGLIYSNMPLRSGKALQRVHYERRDSGIRTLNWESLGPLSYTWGNNTFYTSEELLTAPPSLTMALGPLLVSSYSLSFLDKLDRLQLPFSNSWTIFVPTRDAWERNILIKEYLDKDKVALAKVFNNFILRSPVYSDSEEIVVEQYSGVPTTVTWDAEYEQFVLHNSELSARFEIESTDALFDNGVAHIVNTVPLPYDLEISISDLVKSGGREHFLDLLHAAGMSHVLEPAANFTVLVPPPSELIKNNYTIKTEVSRLKNMLNLHLIPNNQIENLKDGDIAMTLSGENLEARAIGPNGKFWGLSPVSAHNGQRVLLYESGKTNGYVSSGSSVMFIDRHISPSWIEPISSALRKGTFLIFGILFGLLIGACLVFGLAWLSSRKTSIDYVDEESVYRDEAEDGDNTSVGDQVHNDSGALATPNNNW